ncbi:Uu.00g144540.m01.CDS01 [Anthostomella pinea]|uniref:Uu.00g144540.m01.CDS01 n=1 Tax=Anthostomella pinea TaxID=933095 RepID=A0AAI8VQW4_9PEZI|nr:Uu.00g144540.m01.CDS01 [Anthostomella pinea]
MMKRGVKFRFPAIPEFRSIRSHFDDFHDLSVVLYFGRALQYCKTREDYLENVHDPKGREDPAKWILPLKDAETIYTRLKDALAAVKMLESMRYLSKTKFATSALEPSDIQRVMFIKFHCEPLLQAVDEVVNKPDNPVSLGLVFGFEVLLTSYKAYLWPNGQANKQNSRIRTLKYAAEVQKSIDSVLVALERAHRCKRCHTPLLGNLSRSGVQALEAYRRERRFDLYYQAPWSAGCHSVQILSIVTDLGIKLCHDSGCIRALLHAYNAVEKISPGFKAIPIFDTFCRPFSNSLFLGQLTKTKFSSHYRSVRLNKTRNRPGDTSLFYTLHSQVYASTVEFWNRVQGGKQKQKLTKAQQDDTINQFGAVPFNVSLEKVKEAVMSEFHGPLPVARINYFAIVLFCSELLQQLARKISQESPQADHVLSADVVDNLLEYIDKQLQRGNRHLMPHLRKIRRAKEFFEAVDSTIPLERFLWDI